MRDDSTARDTSSRPLSLFLAYYGRSGLEEQCWTEALDSVGVSSEVSVFLGQNGPLSKHVNAAVSLSPDSWMVHLDNTSIEPATAECFARMVENGELKNVQVFIDRLLDRRDYSGTLRGLDRKALTRALVMFYIGVFLDNSVDCLIADILPHTPDSFLVAEIARHLGVPMLTFEQCGIAPVRFPITKIATQDRFFFQQISSSLLTARSSKLEAKIQNQLETRWRNFQDSHYVESYIKAQQDEARKTEKSPPLRRFLRVLSAIFDVNFKTALTFPTLNRVPTAIRNLFRRVIAQEFQRELRSSAVEATKDGNHALRTQKPASRSGGLFALHYEPESTSFPQGLPVVDQLDAVIETRRLLGTEKRLFVKEHPSQILTSMEGFMGRSPWFYSVVGGLYQTMMIGADSPAKNILDRVEAVFTLTGTIALEAVSRGIPVFHFGSPWWEGCPGTEKLLIGYYESGYLTKIQQSAVPSEDVLGFLSGRVLNDGIFYPPRIDDANTAREIAQELSRVIDLWLREHPKAL